MKKEELKLKALKSMKSYFSNIPKKEVEELNEFAKSSFFVCDGVTEKNGKLKIHRPTSIIEPVKTEEKEEKENNKVVK